MEGPVYSPFIPIPGLPGGIKPPVIITKPENARIEEVIPGSISTSGLFIENEVLPGDTLKLPTGELIVNKPGGSKN
jgi:hypothetical protein